MLKSLILWIMLLALPLQGFATATMPLCKPLQLSQQAQHAMPAAHDHHAMSEAAGQGQHPSSKAVDHRADGKCGTSAACCVGAAMAPSLGACVAALDARFDTIPFDSGFAPHVDLALPERPPQSRFA